MFRNIRMNKEKSNKNDSKKRKNVAGQYPMSMQQYRPPMSMQQYRPPMQSNTSQVRNNIPSQNRSIQPQNYEMMPQGYPDKKKRPFLRRVYKGLKRIGNVGEFLGDTGAILMTAGKRTKSSKPTKHRVNKTRAKKTKK